MVSETKEAPPPYRNEHYDCSQHGHIFGKFYPSSKTMKRRKCVVPGCTEIEWRKVL